MATKQEKPTLIDQTVEQWTKRLSELQPAVDEFNEINNALRAVKGQSNATGSIGSGTGRRGRPRGTGSRAQEFLHLVQKHPGITIAEAGAKMDVAPNYLYRVANGLVDDGKLTKDGSGFHEAAVADAPAAA